MRSSNRHEVLSDRVNIHMASGKTDIVDVDVDPAILAMSWSAWSSSPTKTAYAYSEQKRGRLRLHRLIMNAPVDVMIDHINHNGLDCRRINLRVTDCAGNAQNRAKPASKSGFRGVYRVRHGWCADIQADGKRMQKSGFKTSDDAARHYDFLARLYHGEFAVLNFPYVTP